MPLIFIIGAGPDFGIEWMASGKGLFVFACVIVLSQVWTTLVQGVGIDAYLTNYRQLSGIIGRMTGHVKMVPGSADKILTLQMLLRRAKEVALSAVKLPVGDELAAHLIVPEFDQEGTVVGLRAVMTDDYYTGRRHDLIPLDAPGAPEAFRKGVPVSVPFTEEENHPRVHGRRYKSIACLPIWSGDPADLGVVVAVLSLDSTHPYTFDQKLLDRPLEPLVSPIAQLAGLVLELTNNGEEK